MKTRIAVLSLLLKNILCRPFRDRTTAFYAYLRPLQLSGKAVWFSRLAVGRQKLTGVVQGICQKEGFDGIRTNQFLRETAAARIFDETLTNNIDHG